jgi:hypothetical protein
MSSGNAFDLAVGTGAMASVQSGYGDTAVGQGALTSLTTGTQNTALGTLALQLTQTGNYNTAIGWQALDYLGNGFNNLAIGAGAGLALSGTDSNNIEIGAGGVSSDNGVIRIGIEGTQTSFFAAGISGVNVSGAYVVVNSSGQLGIVSSSRRYKEDIQEMGDASAGLMRLRPVTFRYKQAFEDGSKPLDYGLIAEEVAEVYPDLAVKGLDGQIQTIQYQKLTPMLLNEVQKQHQLIEQQAESIRLLQERLGALESALRAAR